MGMRRDARKHDTTAARQHQGVVSRDWWEYEPRQRVMTIDGPGRVVAVHDGPHPGSEEYEVSLDGGLGGGTYTSGQVLGSVETTEASVLHTADQDYPELGTLLHDRPDPASLHYTAAIEEGMGLYPAASPVVQDDEGQVMHDASEYHSSPAGDFSLASLAFNDGGGGDGGDGGDGGGLPGVDSEGYSDHQYHRREDRVAARAFDHYHPDQVYLRFGGWPDDERSHNNVTGFKEDGVSVYDLDHKGEPMDPDPHLSRGHEHDEYCDQDCNQDSRNDDYGNDAGQEMRDRTDRAERARRQGVSESHPDVGHLVKGDMVGIGHDGEPLLNNVRRVGDWMDHRHLFVPGTEPHRQARTPADDDYEDPEEKPTPHTARSINGEEIDEHGSAPGWPRAGNPNVYDRISTEGEPDPRWVQDARDKQQAMASSLPEIGDGHAARLSHKTVGPMPDEPDDVARHLIEHHGYTHDQLHNLDDPGQGDALVTEHELEHDASTYDESVGGGEFGRGEQGGGVEHKHGPAYGPLEGLPKSYPAAWGGAAAPDPYDRLMSSVPAEVGPEDAPRHPSALSSKVAHDLVDFPDDEDDVHKHLTEYHGIDPGYIGWGAHDTHDRLHDELENDEDYDLDLRGTYHQHGNVSRQWHPRPWEGKERAGGSTQSDADRRALAPISTDKFTPLDYSLSMLVTAATDPSFRLHVTAAWRDVQAKAKRIRAQGGVDITHATEGMVIANVRGDHNVYETGLQRLPGSRQSVATYSCGCKWGAYHWGASDDFSRFAGRMCSHALALQYEAASRGMFGRDVEADDTRPRWVPSKVVVKYDIDNGQHLRAQSARQVPEQAPLLVALASLEDDDPAAQVVLAAVNNMFGDTTGYSEPSLMNPVGPTVPWNRDENPTSAGPLKASEPRNWGSINSPTMLPRVARAITTQAFWQALIPIVRAVAPKVLKAVAPAAAGHEVKKHQPGPVQETQVPDGAQATLHEEPEGALPETDGERTASLGDVDITESTSVDQLPDDALSPENPSMQTQGNAADIVEAFQRSTAARSLMDGGRPGDTGTSDIAKAAQEYLAKTAASSFTAAERDELINESPGVQASNTDRLDIAGTHYSELEKLDRQEDDFAWLM